MNPKIREKTILKKKLLRTTMFSMAIFVALLFLGSAVAASFAGSNATIENNYETQIGEPVTLTAAPAAAISAEAKASQVSEEKFAVVDTCDNTKTDTHDGIVVINPISDGRDIFDLQFSFDVEAASGDVGNAGAGFDGTYFYSTRWASNLIHKYDIDGVLVEEFSIPGVNGLRDLAYDGEYFYGGAAGGTIWVMDFESQSVIDTITGGFQSRAIAYDDDLNVLYVSNWGDPVWVVDPSDGSIIDTFDLVTATSTYGLAYDNYCDGGPYLWVFDQGAGAGTPQYVLQWDLNTGAFTGVQYDVAGDFPGTDGIAGGLFITADFETSIATLGALLQGSPDMMFCYELCTIGPGPEHDLALQSIIEPSSGTGSAITPQVSVKNRGQNDEFDIPVDLKIGKWDYTYYLNEDFEAGLPVEWTVIDGGTTADTWTDTNPGGRTPQGGCAGTFMIADSDEAGSGGIVMAEELISPSFDCSGATEVVLEFAQYYYHLSSSAKVDISIDGGTTWTNIVTQESSVTGPTSIDISAIAAGESDVKLNFVYQDNGNWAWYWMVDNIQVYGKTFVPEYEENILVSIPVNETLEFDFPVWVPDDLGLAENIDIDYFCEAEIDYDDANPDNNYKGKDFTLNYGYFYDIGVTDILSPVSGVGDTQIPEVSVENFGQNDANGAELNMQIQENIGGGESVVNTWTDPTGWTATTESFTLTEATHGVGAENFQIGFVFDGYTYNMNNWNIDDIIITADNETLFEEDFTGVAVGQIPAGWERNLDNWGVVNTANAGGVSPEMRMYWSPSATGRFYLITPYFDTAGYDEITLEFKHYLSHFSGSYALEVVSIATEYVTVYDETTTFDIASGEVLDVTLPAWTPAAPLADVDYLVTACTSFEMIPEVEVYSEDFSTDPVDWTITHINGTAWAWNTANERMQNTYGWSEPNAGYLDSPVIDLSEKDGVGLSFWHKWKADYTSGEQYGYVRGSIDGGDTFPYLIAEFLDQTVDEGVKEYDISSWADDESEVVIRFDVYNDNNWHWYVDDVIITSLEGEAIEDANADNDCMSKVITLEYLHDVGTVEIIPFSRGKSLQERDDVIFHQEVVDPEGDWSFINCDSTLDYGGIENFEITDNVPIGKVSVVGLPLYHDGAGWVTFPPEDVILDVVFYDDEYDSSPTVPSDVIATFTGIDTFESIEFIGTYSGFSGYEWTFELPDSVIVTDQQGWMQIEAPSGFMWGNSLDGDLVSYQIGGDPAWLVDDRAMTLYGSGGAPPSNIYAPGTYTPEAVIENFGTYTEVNFNVTAQILDAEGEIFWEDDVMVVSPMNPADTQTVSFGDVVFDETAADEGAYTLVVETALDDDEKPSNDKKTWNFIIDIYDDIPPETTHEITGVEGDNDWYVSDVTITLTAEDPWPYKAPVGVNNTYISFDGVDFELYVGPVVVTEDGIHEFWYYSDDYNENVEDVNGPFEFQRDATPPSIELAVEGSGATWMLIATVSDDTSGVARVEFYVNDEYLGEVTSAPFEWEYTNAKKGDIAQAIVYDNAGNSKVSNAVEPTVLVSQQTSPVVQVVQKNII
jgi:hypothetical protein